MNIKKGAMFGLDARIALAIFGALSVISGAALYSAIQQSNMISLITAGQEILKSVESYMVDTGQDLPADDNHSRVRKFLELEESTVSGWAGPYISDRSTGGVSYSMKVYNTRTGYIEILNTTDWGGGVSVPVTAYCVADENDCHYWMTYVNVDESIANAMDEYIDGVVSLDTGSIRIIDSTSAGKKHVYLKGHRMLTQP